MASTDASDGNVPSEAVLIRERRQAELMSPEGVSRRIAEAGYDKGVSGRRLREIEEGRTRDGRPTTVPAMTLVQIALILGITATELDDVGRTDAGDILRNHVRQRVRQEPVIAELAGAPAGEELLQQIVQGLDELRRNPHLSRDQKQRLEASYLRTVQRSVESAQEQFRETLRTLRSDST